MGAGARDHYIIIETPNEIRNDYGEVEVDGFVTFTGAWASYKPVRAQEKMVKSVIFDDATAIFKTPFIADVTNEMRINDDGQLFDIVGVLPIGRKRGLEIHVREVVKG